MAAIRLVGPLVVAAMGLALLSIISTSALARSIGDSETVGTDENGTKNEQLKLRLDAIRTSLKSKFHEPKELINNLKAIKEILRGSAGVSELDESDLNELYAPMDIDPELCTDDNIAEIPNFIDYQYPEWLGIFVINYRRRFTSKCTEVILNETDDKLQNMNDQRKADAEDLDKSLMKILKKPNSEKGWFRYIDFFGSFSDKNLLAKALEDYLDKKKSTSESHLGKLELYKKHVIETCKDWSLASERVRKNESDLQWERRGNKKQTNRMIFAYEFGGICNLILCKDKKLQTSLGLSSPGDQA